jgi:predicted Zn-dependent protease
MSDIFVALQRIAKKEERSPLPGWAATHPDPGERIAAVQARLRKLGPRVEQLRLGTAEFMTHIEGLTFGEDPRHGFFQENLFLHPELAFRIAFPKGWRAQNLSQAVVASSPEQDAGIQLTLATGEPAAAARQFVSQQGVQAGEAARETINALPAVLVRFAAQTEQGVLEGVAAFIGYRGRTYQVIGFAPATRYPAVEPTFLQTIESFAPLTDPKALAAKPRRIDVIKIPRPMSITEFAQTYRSVVDVETLTLINQVPDTRTVLPAGTLVKRVVEK